MGLIDPDGRKLLPPANEWTDYTGGKSLWSFLAGPGRKTPDDIKAVIDSQEGMGHFQSLIAMRTAGGGEGSSRFGDTQAYRDIMAYLAQPEYFQRIDFEQFGGGDSQDEYCCSNGKDDPPFARKSWNFLADNIISKPVEGVQVVGYLFYGTGLALADMFETGQVGDKHIKMDMTLRGFKDGKWQKTLDYKDGTTVMSDTEKFHKISIPAVEAMTMGIGFKFKPFQSAFANWGVNTAVKSGVKKGIYQLGPK